ncbi:hypothetical protein DQ384_32775 [Sphaerisporangium album]|uniref:Uncharacterized protein n=1 Tax=Sphaerisporangium album TaxID=509200 RepID=A0A367F4I9_9ACTN|nr:hypothetical protein DQ384_32775 [Sphaerisporangium album]
MGTPSVPGSEAAPGGAAGSPAGSASPSPNGGLGTRSAAASSPAAASPATSPSKEIVPARSVRAGSSATGFRADRPSSGPVVERPPFVPPGAIPELPAGTSSPPPASSSRKRLLLVAGAAVAVAAIGTGAVFGFQAFDRGGATPAAMPDPLPSVDVVIPEPTDLPSAEPSPAVTTVLNSEKTDPKKLTLKEAFARQKVSVGGRAFVRTKVNITAQWDKAAVGAYAKALKKAGCSRILRATYVDSKRQYAVTTGIAVFPTKEAAVAVDKKKDLAKTLWFRGLAGAAGSGADKADISGGYAAGLVWGRYIVFSFATYSDGHTPTTQEKDLGPISGAFRDYTAQVIQKRVTG